ncbi:MAG: HD domain-containing protein [Pirellulaceae bacterium]|nr:HD domain-containing protein [Pirellulaceae bacterium]
MLTDPNQAASTSLPPSSASMVVAVANDCSAPAALESEVEQLAEALAARYEELSLIHNLSASLTLGEAPITVIEKLLAELLRCTDADTLAILLEPDEASEAVASVHCVGVDVDRTLLTSVAIETELQAQQLFGGLPPMSLVNALQVGDQPMMRAIVVPIEGPSHSLGRMIAIRAGERKEFGTIEADLMKSTSMMLGIHLINQRQYIELQQIFEGTINSLVSALDAKDNYTSGHSTRVSELTVELATRLGYDDEGLSRVRRGGILHDIGKIGVDDAVLRKPGKLTDDEFDQIKQHPILGYEILKGIRQFRDILPAVRNHHESWDGRGYPDALAGNEIPRDAQIMAVADAFDAMTSDRPYRSGMSLEKVVSIFQDGRGKQWAPDVVDALLAMPDVMQRYARRESDSPAPTS